MPLISSSFTQFAYQPTAFQNAERLVVRIDGFAMGKTTGTEAALNRSGTRTVARVGALCHESLGFGFRLPCCLCNKTLIIGTTVIITNGCAERSRQVLAFQGADQTFMLLADKATSQDTFIPSRFTDHIATHYDGIAEITITPCGPITVILPLGRAPFLKLRVIRATCKLAEINGNLCFSSDGTAFGREAQQRTVPSRVAAQTLILGDGGQRFRSQSP